MYRLLTTIVIAASSVSFATPLIASPTAEDVSQAATMLGFTPEALAVIDVHGSEVPVLLDRMSTQYTQYELILASNQSLTAALDDEREAQATLRSNPDSIEAQGLLAQSVLDIASARASIESVRSSLIGSLLEDIADFTIMDQVINAQGEMLKLSPAYRLAVSTPESAKELFWALKLHKTIEELNDPEAELPGSASDAINAAHAQQDVQLGKVRADSYAAGNQTQIDTWIASH